MVVFLGVSLRLQIDFPDVLSRYISKHILVIFTIKGMSSKHTCRPAACLTCDFRLRYSANRMASLETCADSLRCLPLNRCLIGLSQCLRRPSVSWKQHLPPTCTTATPSTVFDGSLINPNDDLPPLVHPTTSPLDLRSVCRLYESVNVEKPIVTSAPISNDTAPAMLLLKEYRTRQFRMIPQLFGARSSQPASRIQRAPVIEHPL